VVFGLFHGSVYRFLPTALLGLVLGELRRRSGSILPGVVAHAMTNTTLIVIDGRFPDVATALASPSAWALAGLALVFAAHAVVDSRGSKGVDVG
jgi:sodium transport system permease protein